MKDSKRCLLRAKENLIKILDNHFEFVGSHCIEGMKSPFWWDLNYADYYQRLEAGEAVEERDFQCDTGRVF